MGRDSIERALREFFRADPRGAAGDVDVGVLFEREPPGGLEGLPLSLEADLERELGRGVQAVALNRAPADLVHRVLRDGILVMDRDPSRRIRCEVRRRNEYFDLQPVLREYRRPRTGRRGGGEAAPDPS